MKEPVIETCENEHKFYKEGPDYARCPYCMAIGLNKARDVNKLLIKEIEDYKSLLRLVYKQPISQEMVTKVLKKWEEK